MDMVDGQSNRSLRNSRRASLSAKSILPWLTVRVQKLYNMLPVQPTDTGQPLQEDRVIVPLFRQIVAKGLHLVK